LQLGHAGAVGELRRYHSFGFDSLRWNDFPFRPDDIVISTPPKSGTTWMQMLCALLIFQDTTFGQPLTRISPWLETLTEPLDSVVRTLDAQAHRRFVKSHIPFDGLPHDPRVKYVCVGRDPRDVAVSWMHHEANVDVRRLIELRVEAVGVDDLEDVLPPRRLPSDRRERFWYWVDEPAEPPSPCSLASTLHHHATFWPKRGDANVALFHYADLSRDVEVEMRRLAAFLEIDVPHARWDELVEAASFASMRERAGELAPEATTGIVNADAFFRRGSSGDWRVFIRTDDEHQHYEARVAQLADRDLARWVHAGSTA
jgi:hypothetical protein